MFYGDSCSGVPGAPHERSHRAVNEVVKRLSPAPEFIVFPGDEVIGLTNDMAALRAQWRYWLNEEMAWLDRTRIPLFNATGNHTTYSAESEAVFAEMLPHLPANGPDGQKRLSYFVRRDDLLLVFVHTAWSRLGGEGHVETEWLDETLKANAHARWKFVVGHHPAFPVNGYAGPYARTIGDEHVGPFWGILRDNGVLVYLCSHILAFDAQVHDGVLQITSAGAGTAHRMPEEIEYLHAVQMAIDGGGLRYQVLGTAGEAREQLVWPMRLPDWRTPLPHGRASARIRGENQVLHLHINGTMEDQVDGRRQTFLAAQSKGGDHDSLWIGLSGEKRRLTVTLQPLSGRSPHYWFGPEIGAAFDLHLALHSGMGPGGIMLRGHGGTWTSLKTSSAWGLERLGWPDEWSVAQDTVGQCRFTGTSLEVAKG
ncbi:metallophosphoesterase [uncultured Paracoccus sp.]|uniref:metallophosphoesterase family protein n=1 Tax=uncultured Paracoccus sp. TaxID=189685 RepID=UPI0026073F98|nr:metallophosphoesterase [uncultured Paracoccus sp.]